MVSKISREKYNVFITIRKNIKRLILTKIGSNFWFLTVEKNFPRLNIVRVLEKNDPSKYDEKYFFRKIGKSVIIRLLFGP